MQSLGARVIRRPLLSKSLPTLAVGFRVGGTGSSTSATTPPSPASPPRRWMGSRGARGHGWYVKYRSGRGGRHLQGEYHDRDSPADCLAWNEAVLGLGRTRVYMDVVVQPKPPPDPMARPLKIPGTVDVAPLLEEVTEPIQRLEMDLASGVMPQTVHNFTTLLQNQEYDSTLLYRFEKEVGLCGGDILTNTGKTGRSHRPDRLSVNVQADPLPLWHIPGTVSMLVSSVHEVDSRFFFCTEPSPHLDGIHRAFGRLTAESLDKVRSWQKSLLTSFGGLPSTYDMIVVKAGVLDSDAPTVANEPPSDASSVQTASASA